MFTKRFPKMPLPGSPGTADPLKVIAEPAEIAPVDAAGHDPAENQLAANGPIIDRDLSLDGLEKKARLGAWFIAFGIIAVTLVALVLTLAF